MSEGGDYALEGVSGLRKAISTSCLMPTKVVVNNVWECSIVPKHEAPWGISGEKMRGGSSRDGLCDLENRAVRLSAQLVAGPWCERRLGAWWRR